MFRVLLDPDPAGGGTGGTPPAQEPPKAPETITLPKGEAEALFLARREFEQYKAAQAGEQQRLRDEAIANAAKDKADAIAQTRADGDKKYDSLAGRFLKSEMARVVSDSLAGLDFASPSAAKQAALILGGEVEAVFGDDGQPVVRVKATGLPAAEHLKASIASPEFAHYLKAKTQGGAQPPAPGQPPQGGNGQVDLNEAGYQAMRGMQFGPRIAFPK